MTVFNSPVEIDAKCAKEMAGKGAKLIWVLGSIDARRHAILREIAGNIYSVSLDEAVSVKGPEEFFGKSPVLVCEHGVTSLFLAQQLRKKGVEAHSLEGGVDGMRKW